MRYIFFATFFLNSFSAIASNIQGGECLGNARDPIVGVYLHGMYPDTDEAADPRQLKQLELRNRAALTKIARHLGIRIAVPLAPFSKKEQPVGLRFWTSDLEKNHPTTTLEQIQARVMDACANEMPSSPMALIGFSNGANMARVLCSEPNGFAKVIAIGYNNDEIPTSGCPAIVNHKNHETLDTMPLFKLIQDQLSSLKHRP